MVHPNTGTWLSASRSPIRITTLQIGKILVRRYDAMVLHERFIVDENGKRIGVLLDIEDYHRLLEELEELEALRAYDAAKASGEEVLPLEQALTEIEQDRQ
jgi:hypothetical protein